MKGPFIYLHPEITRDHAFHIIDWLKDDAVRQHLSDSQDVSQNLQQVVDRVNLPVLTHLFCRDGRFYMICNMAKRPVGFVRLVVKPEETEMVIVIGRQDDWGKRMGLSAIYESMKIAFFELRSKKMAARIRPENKRSLRAFLRAGFQVKQETESIKILEITMTEYLEMARNGGLRMVTQVIMTAVDRERLKKVISDAYTDGNTPDQTIHNLEGEIDRAEIVDVEKLSPEVITMNSKVLLSLDEEEMEVSLVYPKEADWISNRLSILSPIGTAIIGYSAGDKVMWDVPSGKAQIHIKKVIYQPEAAGDFHL